MIRELIQLTYFIPYKYVFYVILFYFLTLEIVSHTIYRILENMKKCSSRTKFIDDYDLLNGLRSFTCNNKFSIRRSTRCVIKSSSISLRFRFLDLYCFSRCWTLHLDLKKISQRILHPYVSIPVEVEVRSYY